MTQCTMSKEEGEYCKTCENQARKNENGLPTYGNIKNRGDEGWRTPGGKQPTAYGNVMSKLNISRETAEREALKFNLTIPEKEFEKRVAQRGRPAKKNVSTSDTDEEKEVKPKKKRGRPKKEKKIVNGSGDGDDLIASLMAV